MLLQLNFSKFMRKTREIGDQIERKVIAIITSVTGFYEWLIFCSFYEGKRRKSVQLITHRTYRSADSKRSLALLEPLTQPEIGQFDVIIFIE